MKEYTVKQIENLCEQGVLKFSHRSWRRGYVSRRCAGLVYPYNGRFGRGYVIYRPSTISTQYSYVEYYLY
jgi:hypothetical protein